jgi:hypothetical protein
MSEMARRQITSALRLAGFSPRARLPPIWLASMALACLFSEIGVLTAKFFFSPRELGDGLIWSVRYDLDCNDDV